MLIVTTVRVQLTSLELFIEDDDIILRSCEAFATRSIENNDDVEKLGRVNDDECSTTPKTCCVGCITKNANSSIIAEIRGMITICSDLYFEGISIIFDLIRLIYTIGHVKK